MLHVTEYIKDTIKNNIFTSNVLEYSTPAVNKKKILNLCYLNKKTKKTQIALKIILTYLLSIYISSKAILYLELVKLNAYLKNSKK